MDCPREEHSLANGENDLTEQDAVVQRETSSLTLEVARSGLASLGRSPDGQSYVYQALAIPDCGVTNIECIARFPFVQRVNVSWNRVRSLAPLAALRSMISLDASHNELDDAGATFSPPENLRTLSVASNRIQSLTCVIHHVFLEQLIVDNNEIGDISPISSLRYLKELSIAENHLTTLEGIGSVPLRSLNVSANRLTCLDGVHGLRLLESLNASQNQIISLANLRGRAHPVLRTLLLQGNKILSVREVDHLAFLRALRELLLESNPLMLHNTPDAKDNGADVGEEGYFDIDDDENGGDEPCASRRGWTPRCGIIFRLPQLTWLNEETVTAEEKVHAENVHHDTHQRFKNAEEYLEWLREGPVGSEQDAS